MKVEIVAAFDAKLGIGRDGRLPWYLPEDLKRFAQLTRGHVVLMGYNTYMSLPPEHRPLRDRLNIVLTHKTDWTNQPNLVFADTVEGGNRHWRRFLPEGKRLFVIGGGEVYRQFLPVADVIHTTQVAGDFGCDVTFPAFGPEFVISSLDDGEGCTYVTYERQESTRCKEEGERGYLDLVREILERGGVREDRTGTGTLSVFGRSLRFDLSSSTPVLTTKRMAHVSCLKELLWFIRGETNASLLQKQGVRIWDGNTSRAFLDRRGLTDYEEGETGPIYGYQWRRFGAPYEPLNQRGDTSKGLGDTPKGVDQLRDVIDQIKHDPYSRRIIMSAWNPVDLGKMCLPPCHVMCQFYVEPSENGSPATLSCQMYQRSADVFLGLPFNIMSYAVLTQMIAEACGLAPKELVICIGDAHVYRDHVEQCKLQLSRAPFPAPRLVHRRPFGDGATMSTGEALVALEASEARDFELVAYLCHPAIKAPMAV